MEFRAHPVYSTHASSERGEIRNQKSCKLVPGSLTPFGYCVVQIGSKKKGPKPISRLAHRVVWECFHGRLLPDTQIHHVNGNKLDNRLSNLAAVSAKEHNRETAAATGLHKSSGRARTTAVRRIDPDNPTNVEEFPSMAAAGEATGIDWWNVGNAVKQGYAYAGYLWEKVVPADLPGEYWASPLRVRYKGLEVSSCGRIRSSRKNVTTGQKCGQYKKINFMRKTHLVHRIVCEVFHGPPPQCVGHHS